MFTPTQLARRTRRRSRADEVAQQATVVRSHDSLLIVPTWFRPTEPEDQLVNGGQNQRVFRHAPVNMTGLGLLSDADCLLDEFRAALEEALATSQICTLAEVRRINFAEADRLFERSTRIGRSFTFQRHHTVLIHEIDFDNDAGLHAGQHAGPKRTLVESFDEPNDPRAIPMLFELLEHLPAGRTTVEPRQELFRV